MIEMKNKVIIENNKKEKDRFNEYETMKQLKTNNIMKERVELYRDFVINLIHYIHTSYLGKEYIKTPDDVSGHFNWAFNKVIAEFENEGITFSETKELRAYFFDYFNVRFYSVDVTPPLKQFLGFWDEIFYVNDSKEKSLLSALIEIYKLFDISLNKKIFLDKVL